jgi:hypothetical protein
VHYTSADLHYINVRGVNNLSTAELKRSLKIIPQVEGIPWREVVSSDLVSTKNAIFDD